MKKTTSGRKLALRAETILGMLSTTSLERVVGGSLAVTGDCFIMKDTIIIRTSGLVPRP